MSLLGTLLKNRKSGDSDSAWHRPNLQGPEHLTLTSGQFEEAGTIPLEHIGKRVGGNNLSPDLSWNAPPAATTELLLVIEDIDVPTPKPAVHCLVLIDPSGLESPNHLPSGALSDQQPAAGVRILRSVIGRGYKGPEPLKGHGPHRYVFQLFALTTAHGQPAYASSAEQTKPRDFLASISAPVVARGRLTGVAER